ncbi:MAG: hypothetical protein Q7R80_04015 [bacterium]|nr:hypothetical protein [bacterium]
MHVDNSSTTVYRSPIQRWMWVAFAFLFVGTLLAVVAFAPLPAGAASALGDKLSEILASILSSIVSIVGKLLLMAVYLLTWIASYNGFIEAAAVKNGWVIVRDVANMFFIVVLLIIAFATILNVSSYQWKAMLPQLLIAAILINFSKTIAGIFIDISQVIMLTFVNGFAAAAGGNFANMFQIQGLLTLDPNTAVAVGLLQILGGYILAFVLVTIALVTTLIMAVILAFRIVMLWALVVLSPLPYLLNILPQGKKYGEKWWSMFGEYLTAGPVLAFFLWLALVSVGSGTVADDFKPVGSETEAQQSSQIIGGAIPTSAASPKSLLSFVIGICMLLAGLKITGEMSVMGAGAAKGALDKFGSIAKSGAKKFSGYNKVEALYGLRQQRKKEEFQGNIAKWQGRLGSVQQGIGTGLKYGIGGLGVGAGHAAFGRRANRADEAAKKLSGEAALARDTGDYTGAASKEQAASTARAQAASLRKKQRWTERGVNATVAGVATVATGGAGAVLIPGMFGRGLEGAGKKNVSDAKQYTYKKVAGERDAVKNLKPGDILKQAQGGPEISNAEQMAAMITAVEKQLVSGTELKSMEAKMSSLGADDKTMSTFQSVADQKYPGTRLSADERARRVASGTMPTKDLDAAELAGDGGALAKDFVLQGTAAQRKDLGQSKTLKAAYQAGLQAAAATADPADKQKLQAEIMRLGGDKATGQTALQVSGMDPAALAQALKGGDASDILANITPADLTKDVLDTITANAPATKLRSAKSAATKGDDPAKTVNVAAIEAALRGTTEYATFDRGQSVVRGSTSNVAGARKAFDSKIAARARTSPTDPAYAALDADVTRLEKALDDAEKDLEKAKTTFEADMTSKGITANQRELYTSMQTKRK